MKVKNVYYGHIVNGRIAIKTLQIKMAMMISITIYLLIFIVSIVLKNLI